MFIIMLLFEQSFYLPVYYMQHTCIFASCVIHIFIRRFGIFLFFSRLNIGKGVIGRIRTSILSQYYFVLIVDVQKKVISACVEYVSFFFQHTNTNNFFNILTCTTREPTPLRIFIVTNRMIILILLLWKINWAKIVTC